MNEKYLAVLQIKTSPFYLDPETTLFWKSFKENFDADVD
jgi:hypothetical protein